MITIGLTHELYHISQILSTPVSMTLRCKWIKQALEVEIKDNFIDIKYCGHHIWRENLIPATTMFGLESVSEISNILLAIDNKKEWKNLVYIEGKIDEKISKR